MINKDKVSFSELLLWNNKTVLEVSLLCGKSKRTIKDYMKTNKPCRACHTLLIWLFYGVPQVNGWDEWKMRNGRLLSPFGTDYGPRELEMLPILHEWRRLQEAEHNKNKLIANNKIKKMVHF